MLGIQSTAKTLMLSEVEGTRGQANSFPLPPFIVLS